MAKAGWYPFSSQGRDIASLYNCTLIEWSGTGHSFPRFHRDHVECQNEDLESFSHLDYWIW